MAKATSKFKAKYREKYDRFLEDMFDITRITIPGVVGRFYDNVDKVEAGLSPGPRRKKARTSFSFSKR